MKTLIRAAIAYITTFHSPPHNLTKAGLDDKCESFISRFRREHTFSVSHPQIAHVFIDLGLVCISGEVFYLLFLVLCPSTNTRTMFQKHVPLFSLSCKDRTQGFLFVCCLYCFCVFFVCFLFVCFCCFLGEGAFCLFVFVFFFWFLNVRVSN